jgi:hypothetical protein
MSNSATSAAKRRRAAPFLTTSGVPTNFLPESSQPITPQSNISQTQSSEQKMLTLPQVIALVDSRLSNLEKNVIELKSQPETPNYESADVTSNINEESVKTIIDSIMFEHLREFNERYEILANEISDLKNVVMGLQSYTMNVNKILFEEKIKPIVSMSTHTSTNTDNVNVSTALVNDLEPILQTDTQNEVENTVEEPILTSIVDSIVEDENSNQALDCVCINHGIQFAICKRSQFFCVCRTSF